MKENGWVITLSESGKGARLCRAQLVGLQEWRFLKVCCRHLVACMYLSRCGKAFEELRIKGREKALCPSLLYMVWRAQW